MHTSNSMSCLTVEFYSEIYQIRLELGEDHKLVELLTEVFLSGRQLKQDEYIDLVASLYYSYPLLKENYLTVFEALRQVAVDHYNRGPFNFLDCAHSVTDFLSPYGVHKKLDKDFLRICRNPVPDLDIIHTLQSVGNKPPFNRVFYTRQLLDCAVSELERYDIITYVDLTDNAPDYAQEYYIRHKYNLHAQAYIERCNKSFLDQY